ncbi:aminoglycoside phosphotransferase [Streptomyces sp. P38-E01]|uniref:Aminoglycoside phosphotransferase n=1 Tax=Streptomyces tardus TaxID=2780544 RepID=A0A949JCN7_9ACTN|nr:aminoglycoside phosphotransferase [Streptomyces tardus]MBU7597623.1 aminoglycoside phosphotransferase [Streptomyces tardus]
MSMRRSNWHDLPPAARAAVEHHVGPVKEAMTVPAGANSGIAALVHASDGAVFIKGVPVDHPQARTQDREAAINPHLPAACPRLLGRVRAAGWDLIVYEHLDARHATYAPGSLDLPAVADAIEELQAVRCPDGLHVKDAAQRWATYADDADTAPLQGDALLHTDLAPHNVLITDRAHLIDWAWPTRGAAWIDPAVLVLRLMEAGHSAREADIFARRFPSWSTVPRHAVEVFSVANARTWEEIARHDPQHWKKRMAQLAHAWVDYWRVG